MKVAVATLGSAGDLHPFLAVARALKERGHQVSLLSQEPHREAVEAEGVSFVAIADAGAHTRTLQHPKLWHPIDGFGVLWRHLAVPAIGATIDALGTLLAEDDEPLVVFASPLVAGARIAKAKWPDRIRLISGYTAPMGLRSIDDPMFLGAWRVPAWLPAPARRSLWRVLDRLKLEPMARPTLATWALRSGISPPRSSVFGDWLHGPDGGIALYSETLAHVPAAWQARGVRQVGFPLFQPTSVHSPAAVTMFTAGSSPYVVIYAGSAAREVDLFTQPVLLACQRLSLRMLVLSGASGIEKAAPGELWVKHAPLPTALARATAFIHHGGIGSLAEGMAAGVPQLILPSAYDQFENGARLQAMGHGRLLQPSSAKTEALVDALGAMNAGTNRVLANALLHSRPSAPNAAVGKTCDLLVSRSG